MNFNWIVNRFRAVVVFCLVARLAFTPRHEADFSWANHQYNQQWLQVRLGCIRPSPSCPLRRLHTFCFLWPARLRTPLLIWRPSFERQRDSNPPEQHAAPRAPPVCRFVHSESRCGALTRKAALNSNKGCRPDKAGQKFSIIHMFSLITLLYRARCRPSGEGMALSAAVARSVHSSRTFPLRPTASRIERRCSCRVMNSPLPPVAQLTLSSPVNPFNDVSCLVPSARDKIVIMSSPRRLTTAM